MIALKIRVSMGAAALEAIAPVWLWAKKVRRQSAPARAKKGSFSSTKRKIPVLEYWNIGVLEYGLWTLDLGLWTLPNGQKSSSSRTNGVVTSIGLLIKPTARKR